MLRYPQAIAVLLGLAGGLLLIPAADAPPSVAQQVQGLRQSIQEGKKDAAQRAQAIATKYELDDVMHLFKPLHKGGLDVGLGPLGIEVGLMKLAKRVSPQDLKTKREALQRMGWTLVAIARVAKLRDSKEERPDPALWRKCCEEMEKSARGLIDPAECDDPRGVCRAINRILLSCCNCHDKYRE